MYFKKNISHFDEHNCCMVYGHNCIESVSYDIFYMLAAIWMLPFQDSADALTRQHPISDGFQDFHSSINCKCIYSKYDSEIEKCQYAKSSG